MMQTLKKALNLSDSWAAIKVLEVDRAALVDLVPDKIQDIDRSQSYVTTLLRFSYNGTDVLSFTHLEFFSDENTI